MSKLNSTYQLAQELMKHKAALLKTPDMFASILQNLRKAVDDEDENNDEYENNGYNIVDDPSKDADDDEAANWLKENEQGNQDAAGTAKPEQKSRHKMSQWKPREDISTKEKEQIEDLKNKGYTHREAERELSSHKSPDHKAAMRSGIEPSIMSKLFRDEIRSYSTPWLEGARNREKANADIESNSVKRQSGQLAAAHEKNTADFSKAYHDFLNTDKVKNADDVEHHELVDKWKNDWKNNNPQFLQGLGAVSEAQNKYAYNQKKAKQNAAEIHNSIINGDWSTGNDMSTEEALQHLGSGKTEEGITGGAIQKSPYAAFAEKNQRAVAAMKPEQQERLKAVDSAARAQGKQRIRVKGPGE